MSTTTNKDQNDRDSGGFLSHFQADGPRCVAARTWRPMKRVFAIVASWILICPQELKRDSTVVIIVIQPPNPGVALDGPRFIVGVHNRMKTCEKLIGPKTWVIEVGG